MWGIIGKSSWEQAAVAECGSAAQERQLLFLSLLLSFLHDMELKYNFPTNN